MPVEFIDLEKGLPEHYEHILELVRKGLPTAVVIGHRGAAVAIAYIDKLDDGRYMVKLDTAGAPVRAPCDAWECRIEETPVEASISLPGGRVAHLVVVPRPVPHLGVVIPVGEATVILDRPEELVEVLPRLTVAAISETARLGPLSFKALERVAGQEAETA